MIKVTRKEVVHMMRLIHKYTNHLTFISLFLIIFAFILGGTTKDVFLILATIIAGFPISYQAFQAIKYRTFSIEMLVTIAVIGALFIGEYVESAVVTFLFLFGSFLEKRTLQKTRSSIQELTEMVPEEAVVLRDGKEQTISIEDVQIGDRIIIRPGGKVPVDGKILIGEASINEATVTGEPTPAQKGAQDEVFSGTIVDNGYIEIEAEKVGSDTTFARIIELVEEAQDTQSEREKFLNKFANIYTPAIVILSILVYFIMKDLHIAITFLVIACPGALVIGVPVSNVAGIGNGAKKGVLIKGGEVMDELAKVNAVVFDKTGTLTKGAPSVTDEHLFTEGDKNELLRQVATAEQISEHHLGRTIVKAAEGKGLVLGKVDHGEVIKGNGLKAVVEGEDFVIGNRKLMDAEQIEIPAQAEAYAVGREKEGNTAIFVSIAGEFVAIISIKDEIRSDAKEAIARLRANGVRKMIMLTGDNHHAAELVAKELGLDDFKAELLPEDKVRYVKELQDEGYVVAMAGDGINDAPAIATANIGLAMGEGGTDISMETADVVLMADRLLQFAHAHALAKATVNNMKQNIFIAIGTVVLLLIGVLNDVVHLASGMFVHEASVVLVILNGMRLITFKPRGVKKQVENLTPAVKAH